MGGHVIGQRFDRVQRAGVRAREFDHTRVADGIRMQVGFLVDTLTVTSLDGSDSQTIDITIDGANDAPTLANLIADQSGSEGAAFSFTLPGNIFADVDATDTLTLSALRGNAAINARV